MLHEMKLNPSPFEQIKAGTKTVEIRLFDEKRKLIKIGDEIVFKKLPELENNIKTQVIGLTIAPDFIQLFNFVPPVLSGWKINESPEKAASDIGKYYSKKEENEFGVLAVHFKLI